MLPAGQLHPDLVNWLAEGGRQMGQKCIKYVHPCPRLLPSGGPDLRGLPAGYHHGRLRVGPPVDEARAGQSFAGGLRQELKRHGIVPEDVRTLSVDGLLWSQAGGCR